jgi:hypothetical protein
MAWLMDSSKLVFHQSRQPSSPEPKLVPAYSCQDGFCVVLHR